jgi:rubrerythrin
VSKWYAVIERFECRDCGASLAGCDRILDRCPSCGWTDKKQTAFEEKFGEPNKPKRTK